MKQRALALAIKRIVWAELALSAAIAVPAFAQSQPATTGTAAGATTTESTPAAAAAAPASGTAATPSADNNTATPTTDKGVQQLKKFEVTGSLIRSADKVGFNAVQTVTQKDIVNSGATTVADYLRTTSANSANSWGEGQIGRASCRE